MTREERELRARLRAAIGDINGLSKRQLERHIENVAHVVEMSRRRKR